MGLSLLVTYAFQTPGGHLNMDGLVQERVIPVH